MTAQHLRDFEEKRRYATLVAVVLEAKATVIDEIIDLHDRIVGSMFNRAKRNHESQFQQSGKEINHKVNLYWKIGSALLEARKNQSDPFTAIESVISWEAFTKSVTDAQKLARSDDFDYLHRIGDNYSQIRRYAPEFLEALHFTAAPAAREILDAVNILKVLNVDNSRKIPENAPTGFIRKRWKNLILKDDGIDRRFYELCTLSELKMPYAPAMCGFKGQGSSEISTNTLCQRKNLICCGRMAIYRSQYHLMEKNIYVSELRNLIYVWKP